jgi:hypothetical protein
MNKGDDKMDISGNTVLITGGAGKERQFQG